MTQPKSIAEELIYQNESLILESKEYEGLSQQYDSFKPNRDGKTEKNDDCLHQKSTDDNDGSQKQEKSLEQNADSNQQLNNISPQSQKNSDITDKKEIYIIKKPEPTKKSLNIPPTDYKKKRIKNFKYKFYKLKEYADPEDTITMYPIKTFKMFKHLQIFAKKIFFKKNNTIYIVIKKKKIKQLSLNNNTNTINEDENSVNGSAFENDIPFNDIMHNDNEEMMNLDIIANISSNSPSHNLLINGEYYNAFPFETNYTSYT